MQAENICRKCWERISTQESRIPGWKALCNYLMNTYGIDPKHHVIAANEGNCAALAAGYHLATGKVPVVYMQNSGEGNIINPVASSFK